jgi:hypothetical protein
MDATYRKIVDWASEMERVRAVLQLARTAFPATSALCRSFERAPMRVWRGLLEATADACDPGDYGALDATFFDREAASCHYQHRPDRYIWTLKTTALVDTDSCAIFDLHCSAHWPHDTQVGRRVALRNTDDLASLAGDNGYDEQSLRDALLANGVRPLFGTGCSLRTITPTTPDWTASWTGSAGWPRSPFRPSSVDTEPLSGPARGTTRSANLCSPPPSTTSNKPSRSDPDACFGFNKTVRSQLTPKI